MPERDALAPRFFTPNGTVRALRDEARRGEDALDLAANVEREVVAALEKKRELDAGGAGVQYRYGVGHFGCLVRFACAASAITATEASRLLTLSAPARY